MKGSDLKKVLFVFAALSMLVLAVSPAFAGDQDNRIDRLKDRINNLEDQLDNDNICDFVDCINGFNGDNLDELCDDLDLNCDEDDFDSNGDQFQSADSGDVSQNFNVVNTGDNANQCVGGVLNGNTGNVQSQLDVNGDGLIDADDVGSSLINTADGTTTCDQSVDQNAQVF